MQVTQLWRYPVKSTAGVALDDAVVGSLGIEGDRRWALVDVEGGVVLTARRVPELLFAQPVELEGRVGLRLPDGTVTDDDEVLSDWLGRRVALRPPAPEERGRYEGFEDDLRPEAGWTQWQGPAGVWHDSSRTQLSIVAEEALGDWDVRRFRPNVVVRGGDERDLLGQRICLGSVVVDVVKEIDRCAIVARPQPGLDAGRDVLVAIHRGRAGNLGVGAMVVAPGVLRVGDAVEPAPLS